MVLDPTAPQKHLSPGVDAKFLLLREGISTRGIVLHRDADATPLYTVTIYNFICQLPLNNAVGDGEEERCVQPFGISGPPWKKSCLGPHIQYTNTNEKG